MIDQLPHKVGAASMTANVKDIYTNTIHADSCNTTPRLLYSPLESTKII